MQENVILLLLVSLLLAMIGVSYYLYSKYSLLDNEINYIKETIVQNEERTENSDKSLTNDLLNFQEELAEYMNHHSSDSDSSSSNDDSEDINEEFYNNLNNDVVIEELEQQPELQIGPQVQEEVIEKKPRQYNKKREL